MIQTTPMIPRAQQGPMPPITQKQHRRRTTMMFATLAISVSVIALNLTGCASSTLLSPCPNFGASCRERRQLERASVWSVPMRQLTQRTQRDNAPFGATAKPIGKRENYREAQHGREMISIPLFIGAMLVGAVLC